MAAPSVNIKEINLSPRVPSFPGAYGGLVIEAKKGPVNTPMLVTSEAQLLKVFTPDEKVNVGWDLGYYSALAFLQKSSKLWVVRAANTPYYGGVILRDQATLGTINGVPVSGIVDPDAYSFGVNDVALIYGANQGAWNNDISIKVTNYRASEVVTAVSDTDLINVAQIWPTDTAVVFNGSNLPAPLIANTAYYVINISPTTIKLALTASGSPINLTSAGSGTITMAPMVDVVKEPGAFLLEVIKGNVVQESFVCSRVPGAKDGYGRNMYIEDTLLSSNYIRAVDNVAQSTALKPRDQLTTLAMAFGNDGIAVTSGTMIIAAETLANTNQINLTILMDSGHTTPAYQQSLLAIAERRKDCVAILSTPYANESSANYLNDIVDYRNNVLNANSSYGALYTPSVKMYDKFNDRPLYVSPDGFVGAAISETAANYEIWYPVGGFKRGVLNVLDVRRRFTSDPDGGGELGYLYDKGINPIRFAPGKGILIWGQKTLSARPSALDRLNTRCMLIVVEPAIRDTLELNFLFEFNDVGTRNLAKVVIDGYMNGVKARKGVEDFYTVCDATNNTGEDIDNHLMNVHLFIKPKGAIEFIPFYVVLTKNSMDFKAAMAAI